MESVVDGKVSHSLKNAVLVNNSKSHRLLQTVRSLEAERDQNLLSLQIEKDEVVSTTRLTKAHIKKAKSLSDESRVSNSGTQQEDPHLTFLSREDGHLRTTNSLPPLQKHGGAKKLDGETAVGERRVQAPNGSPSVNRRIIGRANDEEESLPPPSPKFEVRGGVAELLNSKLVRSKTLHASLDLNSPQFGRKGIIMTDGSNSPPCSPKALTKQRNFQIPLHVSADATQLDFAHQAHSSAGRPECKQSARSPRLSRSRTPTITRQARTPQTNFTPRPPSTPDHRASTASGNETIQALSTQVHRGLALRPIYSQKEKEQTKRKSSEAVFTRLYKTGAKPSSRKYRDGEGLDRLAHAPESTPQHAPSRLEQRRRSVSLPDLTEMIDGLKNCRYLRRDRFHNNLTDLTKAANGLNIE